MLKKIVIIIISVVIVFIALFFSYSYSVNKNVKSINTVKEKLPEKNICNLENNLPKKIDNRWKIYQNNDYCYFFQYPENWLVLESLEHVGPYVAISDNQENLNSQNPKVKIATMNMEEFASFSTSFSIYKKVNVKNFWIGSRPVIRISGEIDSDKTSNEASYSYADSIIIPQDDKNYYLVLSYRGDNNEKEKTVINKIFENFITD